MTTLKLVFPNDEYREEWYDLREDWSLVEASLAKQYGIRIRQEKDMQWTEFLTLVSGLMPDTPLGQIVSIRAETDEQTIRDFPIEHRKIYTEWQVRTLTKNLENKQLVEQQMSELQNMVASMFGKG